MLAFHQEEALLILLLLLLRLFPSSLLGEDQSDIQYFSYLLKLSYLLDKSNGFYTYLCRSLQLLKLEN